MTAPVALVAVASPEPAVVAQEEGGRVVARLDLPADGRFSIRYRHSYYRAPAEERFAAEGRTFRLESVASPRAAVLDYYELEGARTREGGWLRLRPRARRRYEELALIATATGRRTLVAGGRAVPLFGHGTRHLTISVER